MIGTHRAFGDDNRAIELVAPNGTPIKGVADAPAITWCGLSLLRRDETGRVEIAYDSQGTRLEGVDAETVAVGDDIVFEDEDGDFWLGSQLAAPDALPAPEDCPQPLTLPDYSDLLTARRTHMKAVDLLRTALGMNDPLMALETARHIADRLAVSPLTAADVDALERRVDIDTATIGGHGHWARYGQDTGSEMRLWEDLEHALAFSTWNRVSKISHKLADKAGDRGHEFAGAAIAIDAANATVKPDPDGTINAIAPDYIGYIRGIGASVTRLVKSPGIRIPRKVWLQTEFRSRLGNALAEGWETRMKMVPAENAPAP